MCMNGCSMSRPPYPDSFLTPNLAHMLWGAAERAGDRPAIVERSSAGVVETTYAALASRAAGVAEALVRRGLARDDRVAILMPRGAAAAAAAFGVLAAGGIVVVVNEMLRTRQLEHVLA